MTWTAIGVRGDRASATSGWAVTADAGGDGRGDGWSLSRTTAGSIGRAESIVCWVRAGGVAGASDWTRLWRDGRRERWDDDDWGAVGEPEGRGRRTNQAQHMMAPVTDSSFGPTHRRLPLSVGSSAFS
jgi:hypothetical protein